MKTKLKSILAAALCAVGLFGAGSVWAARWSDSSVIYLDWDDVNKKLTNATCMVYDDYSNQTTLAAGTTYVVNGNVTNTTGITVEGTPTNPARLILCDGAKLVAEKGVIVDGDNALVIYGQTEGTGALEATGDDNCAGIGSVSMVGPGGSVTINGGTVTATGTNNGAGIGGGRMGGGGSVTINGGTVTATGDDGGGAGIGGGYQGDGGSVTINGGRVVANGGYGAAGIGGGWLLGNGGSVKINGGTVTATGSDGGAAIGTGGDNSSSDPDAGTVLFGAKFSVSVGSDAQSAQPIPQDDYEKDHSAAYAHIEPAVPGSEGDPWTVGGDAEDPTKVVGAWTNGTELVIEGSGAVTTLAAVPSAIKGGLTAITIKDATVTGAAVDAFAGVKDFALTLPDGWQGELPKDGNWYGATGVTLTKYPLAVRNVTSQQRYPWNGLVDVSCDLTGAGKVTLSATVLTNGVEFIEKPTIIDVPTVDLDAVDGVTNGVKFIWNAAKDVPAGFKQGDVQVKVTVEK